MSVKAPPARAPSRGSERHVDDWIGWAGDPVSVVAPMRLTRWKLISWRHVVSMGRRRRSGHGRKGPYSRPIERHQRG
jgi:hypothetical protein